MQPGRGVSGERVRVKFRRRGEVGRVWFRVTGGHGGSAGEDRRRANHGVCGPPLAPRAPRPRAMAARGSGRWGLLLGGHLAAGLSRASQRGGCWQLTTHRPAGGPWGRAACWLSGQGTGEAHGGLACSQAGAVREWHQCSAVLPLLPEATVTTQHPYHLSPSPPLPPPTHLNNLEPGEVAAVEALCQHVHPHMALHALQAAEERWRQR